MRVLPPTVWLFSLPDAQSPVTSQLLHGEDVDVLEECGDWRRIKAQRDGYEGWAEASAFGPSSDLPIHSVCVPSAPVYPGPDFKTAPIFTLPLNSRVTSSGEVIGGSPDFLAIDGGYIPRSHLGTPAEQRPVDLARAFLGTPYAWGGRSYHGIDCSGLVQMALWAFGADCPRDSGDQWAGLGAQLGPDESPREGDLVFFPGHVGFYLGGGQLLHANATHMRTTIDPLEDVIGWVARDHDAPLTGFKRVAVA